MDTGFCAYLCKRPNARMLEDCAMGRAFFETFVVSELDSFFATDIPFKDDDTKAKYLNKLVDEKYKAMIISSFNSIDKIVLNLDRMNEDYY